MERPRLTAVLFRKYKITFRNYELIFRLKQFIKSLLQNITAVGRGLPIYRQEPSRTDKNLCFTNTYI